MTAGENADQAAFWSGAAGDSWVAQQAALDQVFAPVLEGVLARAGLAAGQRVLDVGCGTGQSSLAAAERTGPKGEVLGADISPPMLALARQRAARVAGVRFETMDVATHDFPAAGFDRVISRFGVMFFADSVAAFANIARAMTPGALMSFASWGAIEANPFFTLPARVARAEIGAPPKSDPDAPGPFAFRDVAKVERILAAAGFGDIACEVVEMRLRLPGRARALAALSTSIGPAERALSWFDCDAAARVALQDRLAEAFAALPDQAVPAEINFFTARRPTREG